MDELRRFSISFTHQGKPMSWNGLLTESWAQSCSTSLSQLKGHGAISGLKIRHSAPVMPVGEEASLLALIEQIQGNASQSAS